MIRVRGLVVTADQPVTIRLHPDTQPITVRSSYPGLQVCPSGWPSAWGFTGCLGVGAGTVTLPVPGSSGYHVGLDLRSTARDPVRIDALELTYAAVDQFFSIRPTDQPQDVRFSLTPTAGATALVAQPYDAAGAGVCPADGALPEGIELTATQNGRELPVVPCALSRSVARHFESVDGIDAVELRLARNADAGPFSLEFQW